MRSLLLILSLLASPSLVAAESPAARKLLEEGQSLAAKSDHHGALEKFDAAIATDANFPEAHAARAATLLSLKRPDEADPAIKRALELKDEPGFHAIAGRVQIAKGNIDEGRKRYEHAATRSPKQAGQFYADLAGALTARRDDKLSAHIESALKSAIAANPPHLDSMFNLGQSYVSAGRQDGVPYLRRYVDEQNKLPKEKRDDQKIRVARQMIRAMEILKG